MIRVAMIGCGKITQVRHAPEYASNRYAEIAGFYDPIEQRALDLADIYGGTAYKDLESLLRDDSIDAVSVCSSNDTHAKITIQALEAGKHVLCEKPMAISVREAQAMVDSSKKANKNLMIGHNQRLAEGHIKAKELLEGGQMGRILSFQTMFAHAGPETWSTEGGTDTWFFQKESAVLGAIADLGIHKLDLMLEFLDEPIVSVQAITATLDKRYKDGSFVDVEDNAICILRTASGVIGTMTASWTNYGVEANNTILFCENGVIQLYLDSKYPMVVTMKNGNQIFYQLGGIQTNEKQSSTGIIDEFIASIIEKRAPIITGEQGLWSMQVVEACIKSSLTGCTVIL